MNKMLAAAIAAAILVVSGLIIRAQLLKKNYDDTFDFYDDPHDTELGAVM